jgi:hypothetical protein
MAKLGGVIKAPAEGYLCDREERLQQLSGATRQPTVPNPACDRVAVLGKD